MTIPKPLRDSLGLEPGHELEFEEREGALIVRRRPPVDPLRRLVGLVGQRIDVDAYLDETRGPASHACQAHASAGQQGRIEPLESLEAPIIAPTGRQELAP